MVPIYVLEAGYGSYVVAGALSIDSGPLET
jgi:hypothetical protein